jgi:hypothetical protein
MAGESISLAEAIQRGAMDAFVAQEERRGIGPVDRAEFDRAAAQLVRAPQSEDRTLRPASHGGSTERKTRRDT